MAFQNAKGNAAPTGTPKSKAPTKVKGPDVISQARLGGDGYGQNSGTSNPSAIAPGEQKVSAMGASIKAAQDDGEGVLDTIIAKGVHMDLGWQTRDIGSKNVPTHPGTSGASAGPKVPAKLGMSEADPVRKL